MKPSFASSALVLAVALTGCAESSEPGATVHDRTPTEPTAITAEGEPTRVAPEATAAVAPVRSLDDQSARADAVFVGTVVDIQYRDSDAGPGLAQVPFTYVSFRVEDAVQGVEDASVTLRFIGGQASDGRVMMVSDIPRFDRGDTDLLFVAGNGTAVCPLVDCTAGRYRMIDGGVYDELGHALVLDSDGGVARGPRHDLHDVQTFTIGRALYQLVASPAAEEPVASGPVVSSDQLRSAARQAVARAPSSGTFRSTSPGQPLQFASF